MLIQTLLGHVSQSSFQLSEQPSQINRKIKLLKLIASPVRLAIIEHLNQQGSATVDELCSFLQINQPRLSAELARMRDNQILNSQRQGKYVYYSLAGRQISLLANVLSVL